MKPSRYRSSSYIEKNFIQKSYSCAWRSVTKNFIQKSYSCAWRSVTKSQNEHMQVFHSSNQKFTFKNINLRIKAESSFSDKYRSSIWGTLNYFVISHVDCLEHVMIPHVRIWKTKGWSLNFWQSQPFRFYHEEVKEELHIGNADNST